MFVTRSFVDGLREKIVALEAENRTLRDAAKTAEVNQDWMRHRLTQLEKERAQLMYAQTGVKIPAPEFEKVSDAGFDIAKVLGEQVSFGDVGDEVAALMKIGHAPDGTVEYKS